VGPHERRDIGPVGTSGDAPSALNAIFPEGRLDAAVLEEGSLLGGVLQVSGGREVCLQLIEGRVSRDGCRDEVMADGPLEDGRIVENAV